MNLHFITHSYRFTIAIKTPLSQDPQEIHSILDEAKSMLELGKYHNHIVNLQGITYDSVHQEKGLSGVIFAIKCTQVLGFALTIIQI